MILHQFIRPILTVIEELVQKKFEIDGRIEALRNEKNNLMQDIKSLRRSIETEFIALENEVMTLDIEKKTHKETTVTPTTDNSPAQDPQLEITLTR